MKLCLLTSRFPFLPGEQFLETEISYLADAFEVVVIAPLRATRASGDARPVPRNVFVEVPPSNCDVQKFLPYIRGFRAGDWKMLFSDIAKCIGSQPAQIPCFVADLRSPVMLTSAVLVFSRLKSFFLNLIHKYELASNALFYSYWFDSWLAPLAQLRQEDCFRVPIVTRAHGYDLYQERTRIPLRRYTFPQIDWVFAVSRDGVASLCAAYSAFADRVALRYLGVNPARGLTPSSTDGVFRIASCSALVPIKRVDRIAKALMQTGCRIHWVHFGDGPMKGVVEKVITRLPSNVQAELKGQVSNASVLEHYATNPVDVFVNVSSSEGLPVSIMEALSYGIPVVATNVGGVQEAVGAHNGYLLRREFEIHELANVFRAECSLRLEDRRTLRDGAFQTWMRQFDARVNYAKFAAELLGLAERTSGL